MSTVVESPQILAAEMADATKRLRERAWMISPHTVAAGSTTPLVGFPRRDERTRSRTAPDRPRSQGR